MSHDEEARERLTTSMCMWVEGQVQARLSPGKRGLRAQRVIRPLLRASVLAAMERAVEAVLQSVEENLTSGPVSHRPIDGSIAVLDNENPCRVCNRVYPAATLTYVNGKLKDVYCYDHSKEAR